MTKQAISNNMAAVNENKPDIILNSPVGSKPAVYKWPLTYVSKGQKIDGAEEIVETIRWVAREYLEFKPAIENLLPQQPDFKSYDCIKNLCDKYNKIIDKVMKMNKGTSVAPRTSSRASQGLLRHIIQQVYNYAVLDPTELNKYSPFSSETYGETSFEFMAQLIDKNQFRPLEHETFIDLGSGVGHLVLQMAGSIECKKCYGIEIADVPAGYAKLMEERFKFWMAWHGKSYTEFELFHGDFFEKKFSEIIKNATHIMVNNFAFKPDVDHKLKQRFLDQKDGTKIVSSKPFCALKQRVTERDLTDIGSLMHVYPITPDQKKDSVSWTPKPLTYYLHVMDGSRLEKYYEKQKKRQGRSMNEKGRPNKRRRTGKLGSDSFSDDSDDNTVYGPTTRKAWSEWCNASNLNASNRASTDSNKTSSSRNNSTDTENLYDGAIDDEITATEELETNQKREKRVDTQNTNSDRANASSQETNAQTKNGQNSQIPKSCLDKKRDYATKKSGSSFLQNAPPSAQLYSISKPADVINGSSTSKIPNIVIKVKTPVEAKVVSEPINSNPNRSNTELPKQEGSKIIDENGKKLRQRKKSVTAQANTEIPSSPAIKNLNPPKIESKSTTSTSLNPMPTPTTNGIRSKKSASTTKSSSKTSRKKATSPDKSSSLDLLHAKTVESVSGNAGYYSHPAPGCEDHNLRSIVNTPSLPKVVIKDLNMFVSAFLGPKSIDKFINSTKLEFESFAKKIQQPNAKEALLKSLEVARLKDRNLRIAEEELQVMDRLLDERISKLLKVHCDELGIRNSQTSVVNHFGTLLKKHQDLAAYEQQLEAALQPNQRKMNPPAAHSNSSQCLSSPYTIATSSATLDLSLKQTA